MIYFKIYKYGTRYGIILIVITIFGMLTNLYYSQQLISLLTIWVLISFLSGLIFQIKLYKKNIDPQILKPQILKKHIMFNILMIIICIVFLIYDINMIL